jgi:DNA modification methylase
MIGYLMTSTKNFELSQIIDRFELCKNSGYLDFSKICGFQPNRDYYTNLLHSYPAKMLHQIPLVLLPIYANAGDTVLDCFSGSGTTLMQARLYGMNAIGRDINPLAILISRVKSTNLNINKLKAKVETLYDKINKTKVIEKDIPEFPNRDFWFEKEVQCDLARILKNIQEIKNKKYREFFLVCFSSIIRKVSNADAKIVPPVKSKKMRKLIQGGRKIDTINIFKEAVSDNIERVSNFSRDCAKSTTLNVFKGDAKELKFYDNSIDFVITSPPYISAQKYARSTSLEMYWLGFRKDNIKKIDLKTLGTERVYVKDFKTINTTGYPILDKYIELIKKNNAERAYITYKYFGDMQKVISEIFRVLKPNKNFIIVIGNNKVTKIQLPNHEILSEIAESIGFIKENAFIDDIKYRGFMTKRNKTAGMIDSEWILIFRKPSTKSL